MSAAAEERGALVISLDFELHWGFFDRRGLDDATVRRLEGARRAVEAMLEAFSAREIRATWAAVGFLLAPDGEARESLLPAPALRPGYRRREMDPYAVEVGSGEGDDPFHYAPSLVRRILETGGQELASHTFGHYYCLEEGQGAEHFAADLDSFGRAAAAYGVSPVSIVFPRNQHNRAYGGLLSASGYRGYRGNPHHSWYAATEEKRANSPVRRAMRLADSMAALSGDGGYRRGELVPDADGLVDVRASRFLRPYSPRLGILNGLTLRRVCSDIKSCARSGKVYHLWWHPHNFGMDLRENMGRLERILDCFSRERGRSGMESMNMGDIVEKGIMC